MARTTRTERMQFAIGCEHALAYGPSNPCCLANEDQESAAMKVLVIAEAANPEWVSVPLVGWSLAAALRLKHDVHIVTQVRNRDAFVRAGLVEGKDFTALDSEAVARPLWRAGELLRGGKGKGWTMVTAIATLAYYYFEHLVWKTFGRDIRQGRFDIVHRITPLSPTTPSRIASQCKKHGVPFVLGPLNGGVPWPKGFGSVQRQEREWLSYVRGAYRLLPGYRSTLRSASAMLIGSRHTMAQVPEIYRDKCIYMPENAVEPGRFSLRAALREPDAPLRACFVGRLVPFKGVSMLLEAAEPLLKAGNLVIDIIGDGPEMPALQQTAERTGLRGKANFLGWVAHTELQQIMCRSQVFAFPSIREFGGGVVLEAMALGLVPVVIDYAGPGELVTDATGFKIPIGARDDIVAGLTQILSSLAANDACLVPMSEAARQRVLEFFTWQTKADQVGQVYEWLRGVEMSRPVFGFDGEGCPA